MNQPVIRRSFALALLLFTQHTILQAQNLGGVWGGIFTSNTSRIERRFYIFLELKQEGRTVWGVYNTSDSNNNSKVDCLCSVSGMFAKKPGALVDLFKDKVIDYNKKKLSYAVCDALNQLSLHYFKKDEQEYITGRWFNEYGMRTADGASGSLVLQRLSGQMIWDVDKQFPKLEKLIKQGAVAGNEPVLVADDVSAASPIERRLLGALETLTGKKIF